MGIWSTANRTACGIRLGETASQELCCHQVCQQTCSCGTFCTTALIWVKPKKTPKLLVNCLVNWTKQMWFKNCSSPNFLHTIFFSIHAKRLLEIPWMSEKVCVPSPSFSVCKKIISKLFRIFKEQLMWQKPITDFSQRYTVTVESDLNLKNVKKQLDPRMMIINSLIISTHF